MILIIYIAFLVFSLTQDEVYQKILTDKFFRGVVADNLGENKEFVIKIACQRDTYSQMRACIIEWIENNPQEASKMFNNEVETKGGFKISSIRYEYYLNPYVKDLIDKMEKAAKGYGGIETMRELSSFMFEANFNDYENVIENPENEKTEYNNTDMIYDTNYYKLNKRAILNEISVINTVANKLSGYNVNDLGGIINDCDKYLSQVSSYLLTIKNLSVITLEQFKKLTDVLTSIKKKLILKNLVIHLRLIEDKLDPDFVKNISKALLDLSRDKYSFSEFVKKASQIWKDMESNLNDIHFIAESRTLSYIIDLYYSCFFDYLIYLIHKYILPINFYRDIEKDVADLKKYFAYVNTDIIKDPAKFLIYQEKYNKAMSIFEKNSKVSRFHRFIQYIIWDNIIPYDIFFINNKRYFGIKLSQDILSYYPDSYSIIGWNNRP